MFMCPDFRRDDSLFLARYDRRMSFQHIRLDLNPAAVATITLNRPDSLNALNSAMLDEIRAAVERLPDAGARALLLTGEGRGFSSGADLASGGGLPDDVGAALEAHFNPLVEALFALPLPVVAAVNGVAAGAGALLYMLMYAAVLPLENNPIVDDHLIGAIAVVVLALTLAGDTWGAGKAWARTRLVRRYPVLR